jgi:beta-glucuronidase
VALAVALAGALTGAQAASAQPFTYVASPPTKGALYRDGQTDRYLLGGTWLYRPDFADVGLAQRWQNDGSTSGWSLVTVPNSYNAGDYSNLSMNGYVGWYRRDFTLPANAFSSRVPTAARRWLVRFESVNFAATVWLNGHELGIHDGAYLPFEYYLTNLHAGVNRLVVRVDDRRTAGDLPPGPGGGWWNYGGLLQEVYLRAVARADIQNVIVRPLLPCPTCAATIQEQATIYNPTGSPQTVRLNGSYGGRSLIFGETTIAPHGTWTPQASVTIAHPQLWAPGHPFLYKASFALSEPNGVGLGGYVTYSGVRSVTIVGGHLELNGRLLDLRGVDLHEQDLAEGAALDTAHLRKLVSMVRSVDATLIRSHYPLDPQIMDMADRDGILIWAEIPVWRVASAELAQPSVVAAAHALLTKNIETNQNHPSVLLWSVANELDTPATAAETRYLAGAAKLAHKLDPTRPVGMAISDWPGVACQRAYGPLQVLGFNDYFGWFGAGGGATDDRNQLSPFLDSFRACYPNKALFISEFGFDGNRNGPVEERGTYQFQASTTAYHLDVFATKPWLSGAIYWLLQDFANGPGQTGGNPLGSPPFVEKGLFNLQGQPKPVFSVVRAIYRATVQIAPARDVKRSRR